jgi:hypothetical protein
MRNVRGGAAGVILTTVDPQLLAKCARRVAAGEMWTPKKPFSTMAKPVKVRPDKPPPSRYVDPPGENCHQLLDAGLAEPGNWHAPLHFRADHKAPSSRHLR